MAKSLVSSDGIMKQLLAIVTGQWSLRKSVVEGFYKVVMFKETRLIMKHTWISEHNGKFK